MWLLDCEIVDGIPEEILTFSARSRFGLDNELTVATVLMHKTSRCQARFVVTEVHRAAVTIFSFVNNPIIHLLIIPRMPKPVGQDSSVRWEGKIKNSLRVIRGNKLLRALDVTEIGLRQDIGDSDQYLCKPNQEFF